MNKITGFPTYESAEVRQLEERQMQEAQERIVEEKYIEEHNETINNTTNNHNYIVEKTNSDINEGVNSINGLKRKYLDLISDIRKIIPNIKHKFSVENGLSLTHGSNRFDIDINGWIGCTNFKEKSSNKSIDNSLINIDMLESLGINILELFLNISVGINAKEDIVKPNPYFLECFINDKQARYFKRTKKGMEAVIINSKASNSSVIMYKDKKIKKYNTHTSKVIGEDIKDPLKLFDDLPERNEMYDLSKYDPTEINLFDLLPKFNPDRENFLTKVTYEPSEELLNKIFPKEVKSRETIVDELTDGSVVVYNFELRSNGNYMIGNVVNAGLPLPQKITSAINEILNNDRFHYEAYKHDFSEDIHNVSIFRYLLDGESELIYNFLVEKTSFRDVAIDVYGVEKYENLTTNIVKIWNSKFEEKVEEELNQKTRIYGEQLDIDEIVEYLDSFTRNSNSKPTRVFSKNAEELQKNIGTVISDIDNKMAKVLRWDPCYINIFTKDSSDVLSLYHNIRNCKKRDVIECNMMVLDKVHLEVDFANRTLNREYNNKGFNVPKIGDSINRLDVYEIILILRNLLKKDRDEYHTHIYRDNKNYNSTSNPNRYERLDNSTNEGWFDWLIDNMLVYGTRGKTSMDYKLHIDEVCFMGNKHTRIVITACSLIFMFIVKGSDLEKMSIDYHNVYNVEDDNIYDDIKDMVVNSFFFNKKNTYNKYKNILENVNNDFTYIESSEVVTNIHPMIKKIKRN